MTNETNFTEGPWVAGDYDERLGETEIHAGNHKICTVEFIDNKDDANLDLMAAAPEMYAELSRINKIISDNYGNCTDLHLSLGKKFIKSSGDILAKARGDNNEQ